MELAYHMDTGIPYGHWFKSCTLYFWSRWQLLMCKSRRGWSKSLDHYTHVGDRQEAPDPFGAWTGGWKILSLSLSPSFSLFLSSSALHINNSLTNVDVSFSKTSELYSIKCLRHACSQLKMSVLFPLMFFLLG